MEEQSYRLALQLRDRLQAELAQNETFQAFQHVQAIIESRSRANTPPSSAGEASPAVTTPEQAIPTVKRHYAGSQTSKIVNAAADFLRSKGSRAQSGEIYRELTARHVEIRGKVPAKTMASYLSHSPLFDNVPGQGYGLREWSSRSQPAAQGGTERQPAFNGGTTA